MQPKAKIVVAAADGKAAILLVKSETDFTANNDQFAEMAQAVANEAVKQDVGEITSTEAMEAIMQEVRLTTGENIGFGGGVILGGAGKTVGTYVHFNGKTGALVELEGDSDAQLLNQLCMHVSAVSPEPLGLNEEDVPADIVEAERAKAVQEAKDTGKPQEIAEKIAEGKMRKFYDSIVLNRQPFVVDDKQQVQQILPAGTKITAYKKFAI